MLRSKISEICLHLILQTEIITKIVKVHLCIVCNINYMSYVKL